MFDPFEYFVLRRRTAAQDRLQNRAWKKFPTTYLSFARAEHGTEDPRDLQLVPGDDAQHVERCSGHDGTWGVKSEYTNSMKIGGRYFPEGDGEPDYISSDCPIAART